MTLLKSITAKLTFWYLLILSVLLTGLGSGVYVSLSSTLRYQLDQSLKDRAAHLYGFRDLLSIIASGTFEEAQGETIAFYYYQDGELKTLSKKRTHLSMEEVVVDRALSGESFFYTDYYNQNEPYRVYVSPFIPDNPRVDTRKYLPERRQQEYRRSDQPNQYENDRREDGERWQPDPENRPRPPRADDNRRRRPRLDNGERQPNPRQPNAPDQPNGIEPFYIEKAALVIAKPAGDLSRTLEYLKDILTIAIPLTLLISGLGGIFLARRSLKPVKEITDIAQNISENDLTQRISIHTKDELGTLSSTLNRMIERLEKAFRRQKEFTSDASHELRAPLAVIQAEATLALSKDRDALSYRKTIEVVSKEAEQMTTLTNQLLELARADSGQANIQFTEVDLTALLTDICDEMTVLCSEKELTLTREIPDRLKINADLSGIRRVVLNILANAINYTNKGGTIRLNVYQRFKKTIISIEDTGIGIPASQQSRIFERFYRVDKSRERSDKSSGLGLAICKYLVLLHRGHIQVQSVEGKGSRFDIVLPGA